MQKVAAHRLMPDTELGGIHSPSSFTACVWPACLPPLRVVDATRETRLKMRAGKARFRDGGSLQKFDHLDGGRNSAPGAEKGRATPPILGGERGSRGQSKGRQQLSSFTATTSRLRSLYPPNPHTSTMADSTEVRQKRVFKKYTFRGVEVRPLCRWTGWSVERRQWTAMRGRKDLE